jgi:hypothetical protein
MPWLREAVTDRYHNCVSSKRVTLLVATFALALSVIMLSIAACMGHEVGVALGSVAVPLAGLGGWSYVGGKGAETMKFQTNNDEVK